MSKKLTPFFGDMTTPSRVGEYDTKWLKHNRPKRRYWDGLRWRKSEGGEECTLQCFFWRGLKEAQ